MKKIWLTTLSHDENAVKKLISRLKTYGLDVSGHFWEDDLEKMAWMTPRKDMLQTDLWAISASDKDLLNPDFRYGLSLLAITVQAQKGNHFPIIILQTDGDLIDSDTLPTPLRGADILSASNPAFGAKLVAKLHTPSDKTSSDYRLDIYGIPQIGQWFEVGPENTSWQGAMFGVSDAEITFHAVGPKGKLPEKSVLNYPLKDMKLNLGEKEYTAWAVQNEQNPETSYFVKVEGHPSSVVFGSYSTEDETDVYVIELK